MHIDTLLIYLVVSFFYIISPGPAVFLAISNGMAKNIKTVLISSLGNILGLFLLSTISILGLGAMLIASAPLFWAVKVTGALYLIYLGIIRIRAPKSKPNEHAKLAVSADKSGFAILLEGFMLAATNPKPILFFTALFPQFLDVGAPIAPQFYILTLSFMLISFFTLTTYGTLAKLSRKWFEDENKMAWFHKATGGLFIIMGVGLLNLKNANS